MEFLRLSRLEGHVAKASSGRRKERTARKQEGEQWANKIFFGIPMCTYKLRRGNKGKGFGDFWRPKWGLTRCDIALVFSSQFSVPSSRGSVSSSQDL